MFGEGRKIGVATAVALCLGFPSYASAAQVKSGPVTYVTSGISAVPGSSDIQASCPAGQLLTGGGGGFDASSTVIDELDLAGMFPADDADPGSIPDNTYRVDLESSSAGSVAASATAICVKPGTATLTYNSSTTAAPGGTVSAGASSSCVNGEAVAGGFEPVVSDFTLVELESLDLPLDGKQVDPTRYNAAYSKSGPGFNFTTHAVCAADANVKHVYKAKVAFDGVNALKARCPDGTRVLGGGFSSYPTDIFSSAPYDSKDENTAPDDGWKTRSLVTSPSVAIAFANCLK